MKKKIFPALPFGRIIFPYAYLTVLSVNLLGIALVFLIKAHLPSEIPLFYGRPFGQEQLAESRYLVIPLLVALAIALLNIAISIFLSSRFLTQVLLAVAITVTILAFITVFEIIFLVGSF